MILRVSTVFGFLAVILPFVTASHWSRHHQEVAHRARGDVDIHKRQSFTNMRFTFYDVGLGACGQNSAPGDMIVALNWEQYGSGYPGPLCFKTITISFGGKTQQATIMDQCMGCPWGGLDFSRGLFDVFASENEGVIYGEWWFDDSSGGGGGQTSSTSTPPSATWDLPTTTSTPDYPPPTTSSTPDYTPPPTTSSTPAYTPPPTSSTTSSTSSTSSTHSTSSTPSINLSTSLVSGLAVPTGGSVSAPGTSNPQNIGVICNLLAEFGIALSQAEKNK